LEAKEALIYMYTRNTELANPPSDGNFGLDLSGIASSLIKAGTDVYTAKTQAGIAKSQVQASTQLTALQQQTERMRLALQERQAALLAKADEKTTLGAGGFIAAISSPKNILIAVGIASAVGLTYYLVKRRRK